MSKFYTNLFNFSALNWKKSVDEVSNFVDGGKLPCLLVDNKLDLIGEEKTNDPELQMIASENEFCGYFRTSAKTGLNVSESMEFLIKNIVKRMEDFSQKGNEVFNTERKSVALDPEKHNQKASSQRKKNDGCC